MKFRVLMLSDAEVVFERQFDYLLERSPQGANAWADAVDEAVADLGDSADMHGLAPESTDHSFDVFQFMFKTKSGNPYRLLYEIHGSDVFIITIRGLGQDFFESN